MGPGKGLAGHAWGFGMETDARKIASGGKWGYIGGLPRRQNGNSRLWKVEGEKMKPRLSFAFALILTILAGALPMILAHGQATPKVVLLEQFKLTPFPKPASLMPGELACPFFLWTKDFTPEQRISFNYVDKAGMTTSNTPVVANITIIIDSKDSVPVVTTVSPQGSNDKVWQISMSQDTHDANAQCLEGIAVKTAQ
jgi:hypothetical protein